MSIKGKVIAIELIEIPEQDFRAPALDGVPQPVVRRERKFEKVARLLPDFLNPSFFSVPVSSLPDGVEVGDDVYIFLTKSEREADNTW